MLDKFDFYRHKFGRKIKILLEPWTITLHFIWYEDFAIESGNWSQEIFSSEDLSIPWASLIASQTLILGYNSQRHYILIAVFIYRKVRKNIQYAVLKVSESLLPRSVLTVNTVLSSHIWKLKENGNQCSDAPGMIKIVISFLCH